MRDKLKKILIKNWTSFIDYKTIISFCQEKENIIIDEIPPKNQITVSDIDFFDSGILFQVDVSNNGKYTILLLKLYYDGKIEKINQFTVKYLKTQFQSNDSSQT